MKKYLVAFITFTFFNNLSCNDRHTPSSARSSVSIRSRAPSPLDFNDITKQPPKLIGIPRIAEDLTNMHCLSGDFSSKDNGHNLVVAMGAIAQFMADYIAKKANFDFRIIRMRCKEECSSTNRFARGTPHAYSLQLSPDLKGALMDPGKLNRVMPSIHAANQARKYFKNCQTFK